MKPTRSNGWTPERRAKQAEMIRSWQPWAKSTGPKSSTGKTKSSQNSFNHGVRSKGWLALRRSLIKMRAVIIPTNSHDPS